MRRALPIALAAALAFPVAASAHATLQSTTPRFGKEVQRGPVLIRLHFDQHVRVLPGAVKVLNGVGRNFAGTSSADGTDVVASVRPLKLGVYTVRWQAVSADSHVVSGVWTFGVRVPAPSINDAYGAGGPTRTEDVVRWLWFLGIALTIGALGLRLIVLRGLAVPRELDRKIAVAAGIGAVVTLQSGIAAFSLRAEDALQLPFGKFLYGDLSPMAATRFGSAFVAMTLGFALVLALVFLAWLLDRDAFLVPAFGLSLLFAGGLSLVGPRCSRPRLQLEDGARRLGAHLRGVALDRRARDDGRVALVRSAAVAAAGVHAVLEARNGADRARALSRHLPQHRQAAPPARSVDRALRPGAAREDRARVLRTALGCVPPLRHPAGARPGRRRFPVAHREEPHRREPGRRRRAARRGGPRRLAATGEADRNFEYVGPDGGSAATLQP